MSLLSSGNFQLTIAESQSLAESLDNSVLNRIEVEVRTLESRSVSVVTESATGR
jgi:hypothetical protein